MPSIDLYYDKIASFSKNELIVKEELELIKSILPLSSKLIDIGCGTGRHLIPLKREGYIIDGIDLSQVHLDSLKKKMKDKNIRLIKGDILITEIKDKYDGILLFWNSINEICKTLDSLRRLFRKIKGILNDKGRVIINIDDISSMDPSNLDFKYIGKGIEYSFKVMGYEKRTRTTRSMESLKINNKEVNNILIQRWWSREEVIKVGEVYGFSSFVKKIKANNEIYLILQKG